MRLLAPAAAVCLLFAGCSGDDEPTATAPAARTHTVGTTTLAGITEEEQPLALDPDDVEGPLDLKEVEFVRSGDLLMTTIETWDPWDDSVLESPSLLVPGPNRLTLFYDVDLDGRIDYRGRFIFSEAALFLVISGRGQNFEPVPVERVGETIVSVVHAVDVFFVVLGEEEIESGVDLQLSVRSQFEGVPDRAPDEAWIRVPFA